MTNGNDYGLDAAFEIDPDNDGSVGIVEHRETGIRAFDNPAGLHLIIPDDHDGAVAPGEYAMSYDDFAVELEADDPRPAGLGLDADELSGYLTRESAINFLLDDPAGAADYMQRSARQIN